MTNNTLELTSEADTQRFGEQLSKLLVGGEVIYLEGDLGAGKTTLSRAIVVARGHNGQVKSPTYTLVEPYEQLAPAIYHFDLYRLKDPEELFHMGVEDYFRPDAICLIEWPSKGGDLLPEPDLILTLRTGIGGAGTSPSRQLQVKIASERGRALSAHLFKEIDSL